jgi:hypothetical protein
MRHHGIQAARLAAIAAGCSLILAVNTAFAQEQSVVVEPQAAPPLVQPAMPDPGPAATDESIPTPTAAEAVVRSTPPIVYHTGLRARRMLRCQEQVQLVMVAKNPADCCLYEIPLCVPACCEGQPVVREGRGIFGRGVVEYCWPCGFTAKVKFRPVLCDVKVDYSA